MGSNYSEIATRLNSAADTIESNIATISGKKSSFDSIWTGSAHDNLMSNYSTSVTNAKNQVSNLRRLVGCLNNLQSYKEKKESRDRLETQLNNTPNTEENAVIRSRLIYDIEAINRDLGILKSRLVSSVSGFTRVSKNYNIIKFDMEEETESLKAEQAAVAATQAKTSSSSQSMVKTSNSNPDFSNLDAWVNKNPYAQAGYTGQCTWFSWGKFYETYGYSPGFTGDGCQCVNELLRAHGDKFYKSDTPVAGSVFSILPTGSNPHGHTGMIIAVNGDTITVQDGNYNGTSDSFAVAQHDWGTYNISLSDFRAKHPSGVVFANPA